MTKAQAETFDFIIVGTGAAGLVAALTAHKNGLKPLVIEKADVWGGSSALSGGGLWIPNNHLMQADGENDSLEAALTYMDDVIADVGPASSRERKLAYLENGPAMAKLMEELGFRWTRAPRYPDYYPDRPGGRIGRLLEGRTFNGKRLGPWLKTLRKTAQPSLAMDIDSIPRLPTVIRSARSFFTTLRVFVRTLAFRLTGRVPSSQGQSLVAQLMFMVQERRLPVSLSTSLKELVFEGSKVVGVVVEDHQGLRTINATKGVLLCAGGFARNAEFRLKHQGVTGEWSSASPDDQGDAIQIGAAAGAATALMDDAWWGPSFMYPDDVPGFCLWERTLPGSIIVDDKGERYFNEAESYIDAGHAMLARNKIAGAIPSWLIMDGRFRRRYVFGTMPPGLTPKAMFTSGFFEMADTLDELARKCGIDAAGLKRTVERHNAFSKSGVDEDFGRGRTVYDHYFSDSSVKPNPTLGPIDKGPYLACKVYPGDLGTKGGLLTDEHARVLRDSGEVIDGLYASGNTTASVMGRTYPGPGSTLGPATTFAYIAANHAARQL
ncbi:FAD-dependent oxidoreductase [Xanthomonas hortorum]|uniref:FAD-dependent oxidoreductase n=1 Tax=Xanthomonas hortorum TaxID=56454 RepID=UPI001593996F|nr:FAD-dependent oxidoreductase [Xanthomonas hortorum]NHF65594.1 FAD-binding protein [Xanthomonas hortorum]